MREIYIKTKAGLLPIGRRGENLATRVHLAEVPESGQAVTVYVLRNGDTVAYPASNVEITDTEIIWTVTSVDTGKSGRGKVQYKFSDSVTGEIIKTEIYHFVVGLAIDTEVGPTPDPYETWLDSLTDLAGATQVNARAAESAAASAQGSAEAASGSAGAAAQSASQASGKATEAAGSATTASQKASEAASSASAAAGSATAASGAAGQASASQTAAAASAEAASASATSAGQSKDTAQTAAQTATTKASEASASATSAASSASTAATKAGEASESATSAASSASTASTKASEASASATSASGSASTATTKASEASASASAAAGSASSAQTAQAAAEAAQTAAEAAAQTLVIDSTLTQTGQAADAKKVGDEIGGLKSDLKLVNAELNTPTNKSLTATVSQQYTPTNLGSLTLVKGRKYTFTFSIPTAVNYSVYCYLKNADNTNISTTTISIGSTQTSISYRCTEDDKLVLLVFQLGASYSTNVTCRITDNAVSAIETINESLNNITSYSEVFNGFVNKGVTGTKILDNENAVGVYFPAITNMYYHIVEKGNANRFILYGELDGVATELFRYTSNSVPNPAEYIYQNTAGYSKLLLVVYYGVDPSLYSGSVSILESDSATIGDFTVKGIKVATLDDDPRNYFARFETINQKRSIDEAFNGNLYLIAVKSNNYYYGSEPNGTIPTAEGYLYLNESEQKLYYSSCVYDRPEYLCDWDSSVSGGKSCQNYHCTITRDGDIIFWERPYNNLTRTNPIIYEHTDYTSPHIIDFGNDTKPFGFAVDSGIDHSYNGDFFMYGEYRGWSESDNDTPIYIWKVVKPYNTKSCWSKVCTKYVRHYNSGAGTHPGEEIGHFHTVNFDFYSGDWIASTGDVTDQCQFLVSSNDGVSWTKQTVISGQPSRTVGVIFTADGMWYQTDSTGTDHALYYVERDENGHVDFSTQTKVCALSDTGSAGYGTALMREPYGLLFIDRMEGGGTEITTMPLYFYDLSTGKLHHLMDAEAISGYTDYDYVGRFGLPPLAYTHYQSPYEDGIIMGATTITKPFLLDLVHNKDNAVVGVLKESIY